MTDIIYDDDFQLESRLTLKERAEIAPVPAVAGLGGAGLGILLGLFTPKAALLLALFGAFGGQLPKNPAWKSFILGASFGMAGAGVAKGLISPTAKAPKPTIQGALNELVQGLKAQWPISQIGNKPETQLDGENEQGSVPSDLDAEFEAEKLRLMTEAQNHYKQHGLPSGH